MRAASDPAAAGLRGGRRLPAGPLRTGPLAGELTSSLIGRVAGRYGMERREVLAQWSLTGSPARHPGGGGVRADAEVVLNGAGRRVLAELCGVDSRVLAWALPAYMVDGPAEDAVARGRWRAAQTVAGQAVFGCRSCAARRTGQAVSSVVYRPRWRRVCVRHGKWLLDADADPVWERLELGGVSEVVRAQYRWAGVRRRAVRAGRDPDVVFDMAHAVVCRWWDQAPGWEEETIWPRRLYRLAEVNAGGDLGWWRIVGRDAVVFPEAVAVAGVLLEPGTSELAWEAFGGERLRARGADDPLCGRLGERVGRPWLGPLAGADYDGALSAHIGALARARRPGGEDRAGWRDDPWRVGSEHRPATAAALLRVRAAEVRQAGSGTRWRAVVSAGTRMGIGRWADEAAESLGALRGVQGSGTTREVARVLLESLTDSAEKVDLALLAAARAALDAGVGLDDVAGWCRLPAGDLVRILAQPRDDGQDEDGTARV
nr:TniQ family protein [Streptomyces sp. AS13]